MVLGIVFFTLITTGLILNTIFLVREIRRNEQHDAFLNAVTHELKTPIASIKLYLETLKTRELPPEKRREFYDVMLADNDRLLRTVEQVLLASRSREKKKIETQAEVELGELLRETIEVVKARNHLDDDAMRFNGPEEKITVLGDRAELQTVFANLLDNSVKYSNGTPKIAVRLKSSAMNHADVIVKDNGIGIAPGDLKRIFNRFYRASNGSSTKGTGLGLAIVRAIVKKHGGKVGADSKGPGRGSTFWVRLPRV